MNNYECDMQVKIVIACAVLHNFLREHQSSDEIFNEYESNDMVIVEQSAQVTKSCVLSTSRCMK